MSDEKKEPSNDAPALTVVERREIRTLPAAEQQRFAKCLQTMMVDRGDGTSVYSDLADIHGRHCAHGRETFPGWHRAYLIRFERAMQRADEENGNDGNIALPYWDWTNDDLQADEPIPNIVVEHFSTLPDYMNIRVNRGPERRIAANLRRAGLTQAVFDCLDSTEHWRHASTRWAGFQEGSVESPHNNVHVALGYPMGSVAQAAYDPMFWLHHCNVDRIYESYLKIEPDSQVEFEAFQEYMEEKGGENIYDDPLVPFNHPVTGEQFMSADTFAVEKLGYTYDKLIPQQVQQQQAVPIVAYFKDIDIMKMKGKCYQLHVFVVDKSRVGEYKAPEEIADYENENEYAGMGAVFGRGKDCVACEKRPPFQVFVPIAQALNRQELTIANAELITVCVEANTPEQDVVPIENTPVPKPIILGPGFNNSTDSIRKSGGGDAREIENIQKCLKRYGYLEAEVVFGVFGDETEKALKRFQKQFDLEPDGSVGRLTKQAMLEPRCFDREITEKRPRKPAIREGSSNPKVSYFIGKGPGKIERKALEAEVREAFGFWEPHVALKFSQVKEQAAADITIQWTLSWMNARGEVFPFDGRGLTLARGIPGEGVKMDRAENWKLCSEKGKYPAKTNEFYIRPVLIHELGHVFGLEHVDGRASIMSPYYNPFHGGLTENDFVELKAVIGTQDDLKKLRPEYFAQHGSQAAL